MYIFKNLIQINVCLRNQPNILDLYYGYCKLRYIFIYMIPPDRPLCRRGFEESPQTLNG